jgi:hypothetical protein
MLPEQLRERVDHQFILRHEFLVALFGLVSNWLDYFDVKVIVTGNEFPKALTAELQIIALILTIFGLLPIAAPIDATHWQRAFVLAINPCRRFKISPHFLDLATVSP